MAEVKKDRHPTSDTRIDIRDENDVAWWAEHFGISEEQLRTAVQVAGSMVIDVQEEIERAL